MNKAIIIGLLLTLGFTLSAQSWYGVGNIGITAIDTKIDGNDFKFDAADKSDLYFDLGVYGIAFDGALLGLNLGTAMSIYDHEDYSKELVIANTLIGVSGMYYINGEIGSGFFGRVDCGVSIMMISDSPYGPEGGTTDLGFGLLVGGGYAINLDGPSILINVDYSYRNIEDGYKDPIEYDTNILTLSVGLLFS